MTIEDVKKIAQEEMSKLIMENLDSSIMFKYVSNLEKELKRNKKIIDLMAEQLTTDIHSKEWVIDYYEREVEEE